MDHYEEDAKQLEMYDHLLWGYCVTVPNGNFEDGLGSAVVIVDNDVPQDLIEDWLLKFGHPLPWEEN